MSGTNEDGSKKTIDVTGLFRRSAKITFIVEIVSAIVMLGSVAAYLIGGWVNAIGPDIQILLVLVGSVITLVVFLAAFGIFVRFSGKIGDAVVGLGLNEVPDDTPKVKTVVYTYLVLVVLIAVTGVYAWYLVDRSILAPWASSLNSIALRIFGLALGAFVISLLIQLIIAIVGRTATKVVIEVLDLDEELAE